MPRVLAVITVDRYGIKVKAGVRTGGVWLTFATNGLGSDFQVVGVAGRVSAIDSGVTPTTVLHGSHGGLSGGESSLTSCACGSSCGDACAGTARVDVDPGAASGDGKATASLTPGDQR